MVAFQLMPSLLPLKHAPLILLAPTDGAASNEPPFDQVRRQAEMSGLERAERPIPMHGHPVLNGDVLIHADSFTTRWWWGKELEEHTFTRRHFKSAEKQPDLNMQVDKFEHQGVLGFAQSVGQIATGGTRTVKLDVNLPNEMDEFIMLAKARRRVRLVFVTTPWREDATVSDLMHDAGATWIGDLRLA